MRKKRAAGFRAVPVFLFFMAFVLLCGYSGLDEKIFDEAGLLTDQEEEKLQAELVKAADRVSLDVVIVTIDDAEGKDVKSYADDYYDAHHFGYEKENGSGILFLIDMDNREVYLATTGDAIYYLTDNRIEDIIDGGYDYVVDGAYKAAFSGMMTATGAAYDKGIPSDQYTYDEDTGKIVRYQEPKSVKWYEVLVALALACGAFLAVFLGVLGKYRLKWDAYKYDFHANGRVDVTNQEDRLVNQLVTHRHIQRNTSSGSSHSSGSRSSVHTGSGGRSYGGGGRKF